MRKSIVPLLVLSGILSTALAFGAVVDTTAMCRIAKTQYPNSKVSLTMADRTRISCPGGHRGQPRVTIQVNDDEKFASVEAR